VSSRQRPARTSTEAKEKCFTPKKITGRRGHGTGSKRKWKGAGGGGGACRKKRGRGRTDEKWKGLDGGRVIQTRNEVLQQQGRRGQHLVGGAGGLEAPF